MDSPLTLFGEQPDPQEKPPVQGILWSSVRSSARCGRCTAELVETKGQAPIAQSARYRRRAPGSDELFCYRHAQGQRAADGMPALRPPRA